jgi:UDP-N-acetylglucosamine 3-dehydrogenase
MKKYGVGVVGVGVWGCHSLERELVRTGRAEIRAITYGDSFGENCYGDKLRSKAEEHASATGAEILSDWRELIARPDVDIVSAMLCPKLKAEIIVEALRHGKHVVTDKPLGLGVGDAKRIVEAEKNSSGKGFMLAGYQKRPGVKRLIEAAMSGVLGEIKALSIRLNFMGGIYPGFVPTTQWRSEVPSGEMTTIGSHAIITAMKIMREPVRRIYAVAKNDFYAEYAAVGAEDYAIMNLQFASGAVANISIGRLPYRIAGEDILIELTGSTGYACLKGASFELWPKGIKEEVPADPPKVLAKSFAAFIAAIDGHGDTPVSFTEGLRLQEILEAAINSAKTGDEEPVIEEDCK